VACRRTTFSGAAHTRLVIAPTFRRRYAFDVPSYSRPSSAAGACLCLSRKRVGDRRKEDLQGNGFVGGAPSDFAYN